MENKFRNEMEIKLAGETILLRPTFEALAKTETEIGALHWLAFKFGKGVDVDPKTGKTVVNPETMPPLHVCAKMFFLHQAEDNERKFTLEEMAQLCIADGMKCTIPFLQYLTRMTAGNNRPPKLTEKQKKS